MNEAQESLEKEEGCTIRKHLLHYCSDLGEELEEFFAHVEYIEFPTVKEARVGNETHEFIPWNEAHPLKEQFMCIEQGKRAMLKRKMGTCLGSDYYRVSAFLKETPSECNGPPTQVARDKRLQEDHVWWELFQCTGYWLNQWLQRLDEDVWSVLQKRRKFKDQKCHFVDYTMLLLNMEETAYEMQNGWLEEVKSETRDVLERHS